MLMGPLRLQGLSRPDSSLESLAAIPVIHCSRFHFPASAAAAVINGLVCYFPVWVPFFVDIRNVNFLIRHIFELGVQG